MTSYTKPSITSGRTSGLFPILGAPIFISPVAPIVAGVAAVASVMSKKGNSVIDSTHTGALTARKDFALT